MKANMNTGNKILGKHIRQFVTRTFDVLVVQNNGKGKIKKRAARANFFFLLIRRKSERHVQFGFLLIRSSRLGAIFIVVPV